MANYFLIKFENTVYANRGLYVDVIAKGNRALQRDIARKLVVIKPLFDQLFYSVTPEQQKICEKHSPVFQDLDSVIRHFNIVSKDTLRTIKERISEAFYNACVVTIDGKIATCFKYRHLTFFKVRSYCDTVTYGMLRKMACIKVCGLLYVALNAVDVRVESPIIATLKD